MWLEVGKTEDCMMDAMYQEQGCGWMWLDALRNRLHKRFHTVFTSLKLANVETLAYTNHITSLYLPLYDHSDIVLILYVGDCCW